MSQIICCTTCGADLGIIKKGKVALRTGETLDYPCTVDVNCECGKGNKVS